MPAKSSETSRLLWYRSGTSRSGINHGESNLMTLIREATYLGRCPVVSPPDLHPKHNHGHLPGAEWSRYRDLDATRIRVGGELQPMNWIDRSHLDRLGIGDADTLELEASERLGSEHNQRYRLVIRDMTGTGLWRRQRDSSDSEGKIKIKLMPSRQVLGLAERIRLRLGDYAAVHVRRGDKLELVAPLRDATSPRNILARLAEVVEPGRALYVLTDEWDRDYFAELRQHYDVRQFFDFDELAELVSGPQPDNYLLYEVEKQLFKTARPRIWTFRHERKTDEPYLCEHPGWS